MSDFSWDNYTLDDFINHEDDIQEAYQLANDPFHNSEDIDWCRTSAFDIYAEEFNEVFEELCSKTPEGHILVCRVNPQLKKYLICTRCNYLTYD